ncbi:hypothetical protein BAE44_0000112 [Dichanthelium oligosanthes]|uniref:Uncharacterized protein n=1 Tax=Dichanthelium oligosanthes TaxID=888268 RepID=A0A1E5WN88_9POAL|nr:hypothetical protein BAE44_0000112 [Dichanthelium oligosanthes]
MRPNRNNSPRLELRNGPATASDPDTKQSSAKTAQTRIEPAAASRAPAPDPEPNSQRASESGRGEAKPSPRTAPARATSTGPRLLRPPAIPRARFSSSPSPLVRREKGERADGVEIFGARTKRSATGVVGGLGDAAAMRCA